MHVSSTRVKELILFGRDVKGLVPELIREEVEELLSK